MKNSEIGARIRAVRLSRHIKRMELAELLGISASTVAAYENGDIIPPVETLSAIADIFSISLNMLVFGIADPGENEMIFRE